MNDYRVAVSIDEGKKKMLNHIAKECQVPSSIVLRAAVELLFTLGPEDAIEAVNNFVYRAKLNHQLSKEEEKIMQLEKEMAENRKKIEALQPKLSPMLCKWEHEEEYREPGK